MRHDPIKRVCERLGLNQKNLAEAAGVNPSRISDVRHGRMPGFSRKDVERLLVAFPREFTTDELLFYRAIRSESRPPRKAGGGR